MKNLNLFLGLGGSLLIASPVQAQKKATDRQPNVIFIIADDLGYGDMSCYGAHRVRTPHVDALADSGIRFTDAHAVASTSTPSRYSLFTGHYAWRRTDTGIARGDAGMIIRPEQTTIADMFKVAGYTTGAIGKWHLGDDEDGTGPLSQGFIWNVGGNRAGAPYSYFYPYCLPDKSKCHVGLEEGILGEYLTDRLTEEAVSFIKSHSEGPFFLHLSHHAVHTVLQAPDSLINKYRNKTPGKYHKNPIYAAMIEKLDDSVDRICQVIKTLGIADRTIVIFYSDNGGSEPVTDNYPLNGGKGMPYEGGSRVPLIIRWTGKIEGGIRSSVPITGVDFYPTFVTLAQGKIPANLDGKDIFTLINNNETERDLFWHFPAYLESYLNGGRDFRAKPYSSIRSGDWKLIYHYEDKSMELFNLKNDLGESQDLSGSNPVKRGELYQKLMKWIQETHAPIPVKLNPYYRE